jgi:hypothetical protein
MCFGRKVEGAQDFNQYLKHIRPVFPTKKVECMPPEEIRYSFWDFSVHSFGQFIHIYTGLISFEIWEADQPPLSEISLQTHPNKTKTIWVGR